MTSQFADQLVLHGRIEFHALAIAKLISVPAPPVPVLEANECVMSLETSRQQVPGGPSLGLERRGDAVAGGGRWQ